MSWQYKQHPFFLPTTICSKALNIRSLVALKTGSRFIKTKSFTPAEIHFPRSLIEPCLADLEIEIQVSDNMGFRPMLRERKAIPVKLLETLPQKQDLLLQDDRY